MANIELKNVKKIYPGNILAVDDFCLKTEGKEFIVFVGPSGCGKSTTLRMIAGLEETTHGEIFIDSKLINNVHPKDRDIAMVFQDYALYPHMSVFDNMAFSLKMRKTSKSEIKRRVEEVAKTLDLQDYLDRKPKNISGGQRQRVALGRAIVRHANVFLLDEPLSNLDAKLRTKMRKELIELYQSLKATFIYVTHDQVEAMTMGTVLVVMNNGVIQQTGSPQEIYENPCNMFVATFIGSPQMNIIMVKIEIIHEKIYAVFGQNKIRLSETMCKSKKVQSYVGKNVYMGIRPCAIAERLSDHNPFRETTIAANVEVIEYMGQESCIYLNSDGYSIIAKVEADTQAKVADKGEYVLDEKRIYLFNPESEMRIEV